MLPLRFAVPIGIFTTLCTLAIAQSPHSRTPVVVELFTSEGCSSCPPADALLAKLDRDQPLDGIEVIALSEHVDYWDRLGWRDRFSSHLLTERQGQYSARLGVDGVYTPQMIVNGADQFVGSDAARAQRSIERAAQTAVLHLSLTPPVRDGRTISSSLSSTGALQTSRLQGDIYIALVDAIDNTDVRNGENGGRRLHHVGVVRVMQRVGTVRGLGQGQLPISVAAPADANPMNLRLVAFVQQKDQGAIFGAVAVNVNPPM